MDSQVNDNKKIIKKGNILLVLILSIILSLLIIQYIVPLIANKLKSK